MGRWSEDTNKVLGSGTSGKIPVFISSNELSDSIITQSGTNIGINVSTPDSPLEILNSSNEQLRLSHTNGSVFTDFETNALGNMTIIPSGDTVTLSNEDTTTSEMILRLDGNYTGADGDFSMLQFVNNNVVSAQITSSRSGADNTADLSIGTINSGSLTDKIWIMSNGNVGVGTDGPDAKLDVLSTSTQLRLTYTNGSIYTDLKTDSSGNFIATPSSGQGFLVSTNPLGFNVSNNGSGDYMTSIGTDGSTSYLSASSLSTSTVNFVLRTCNAGNETIGLVMLGSNQYVGIQASTPARKLEVTDTNQQLRLTYSTGSIYTDFFTESNGDMRIDPTGNSVYIGGNTTITPFSASDDLVIDSGASDVGINLISTSTGNITFGDASSASIGRIRYNHSTDVIDFLINSTVEASISSGGLKIGASTSIAASTSADNLIIDDFDYYPGISLISTNDAGTGSIYFGDPSANNSGVILYDHNTDAMSFYSGGVQKLDIDSTGVKAIKQIYHAINTIAASGGTVNVNFNSGNIIKVNLSSATTLTFSNPAVTRYTFIITQSATVGITWPTITWLNGATAPTLSGSGKTDVVSLVYDGSTYYGAFTPA
jgi:hypothetical protein